MGALGQWPTSRQPLSTSDIKQLIQPPWLLPLSGHKARGLSDIDLKSRLENNQKITPEHKHEITSTMDITIDTRIKYRVGSPLLPVLPVFSQPTNLPIDKIPGWLQHLNRIGEILDENEITPRITDVGYRFHADRRPQDSCVTITTRAAWTPRSDITWPNAVRDIRAYLNEKKIQLAVEIIAPALYRGLKPFPFARDTYNWNDKLLPEIRDRIMDHQWVSLDMIYQEDPVRSGTQRPVILIGARDADENSWWDSTLPALQQLDWVTQSGIQVELVYRDEFLTAASDGLSKAFETSIIPVGASCGVANRTGSGTLGGKLVLEDPRTGKKTVTGISNHHVLVHERTGPGPFSTFDPPIIVVSPSDDDRQTYASCLQSDKERFRNDFPELVCLAEQASLNLEEFDTGVGHVFASSGLRGVPHKTWNDAAKNHDANESPDPWALDWSLTTIDKRRIQTSTPQFGHGDWKEIVGYCSIDPYRAYRVQKHGRTSGSSSGFISATQSACRHIVPEPEDGLIAPKDVWKDMVPSEVRCHVMIANHANYRSGDFIQPGDSGSLILIDPTDFALKKEETRSGFQGLHGEITDSTGPWPWEDVAAFGTISDDNHDDTHNALDLGPQFCADPAASRLISDDNNEDTHKALVVGLAFGSTRSDMLSYMMPIDLVIQDIEAVTECKVIDPPFAGLVRHESWG